MCLDTLSINPLTPPHNTPLIVAGTHDPMEGMKLVCLDTTNSTGQICDNLLPKTDMSLALIVSVLLKRNDLFRSELSSTDIRKVVEKAERLKVFAGDVIVKQGDDAFHFFIIESGRVEFFNEVDSASKQTHRKDQARIQLFKFLTDGECFGKSIRHMLSSKYTLAIYPHNTHSPYTPS